MRLDRELRALGHDVRVEASGGPAPGHPALAEAVLMEMAARSGVDLVVHGELSEGSVDLGSYGTHKTNGRLMLVAVGPRLGGGARTTTLAVDDQDGDVSVGKPMLAARLPGILPPFTESEVLNTRAQMAPARPRRTTRGRMGPRSPGYQSP